MKRVVALCLLLAIPALATHDPNRTATIFVHGFNPDGWSEVGVFGEDDWEDSMTPFAELAGLPHIGQPGGINFPNCVASTHYYGDTPPDYYDADDLADLDAINAQWGGGVPRYALIVAKYARRILEISGAEQINFFSGSYGSFVTRWLIEKDVEGLASEGKIARWLSAEGVLSGHWAASNDVMIFLWEEFSVPSLDVDQLHYDWVETHLHSPRWQADNPDYGNILISMMGSVNDSANDGYMTDAMLLLGEFQPNDGVVGLYDSYFHEVLPASQFLGLTPMQGYFDVDHYSLADYPAAWATVTSFLTGRKRARVTLTRTQVEDMHEPDDWAWDFTPAEIVIQNRVWSPLAEDLWQIIDPLTERHREAANSPIYEFGDHGSTLILNHSIFDAMVEEGETELRVDLWAEEIDWDEKYDIFEIIGVGDPTDDLGGTSITLPLVNGTYSFNAPDWNGDLLVEVFDYPFDLLESPTAAPVSGLRESLQFHPNPFREEVLISCGHRDRLTGPSALEVFDAQGKRVHQESFSSGEELRWSGQGSPSGVYFLRLSDDQGVRRGRVVLLR